MKLAVVPIEGIFEDEYGEPETALENVYTDGEQFFLKDGHGKLTKEQFEVMIAAFRAEEDEGFSTNQCLQEALGSVGIEVEW